MDANYLMIRTVYPRTQSIRDDQYVSTVPYTCKGDVPDFKNIVIDDAVESYYDKNKVQEILQIIEKNTDSFLPCRMDGIGLVRGGYNVLKLVNKTMPDQNGRTALIQNA